jgi:hypothetical protein
MRNNLQIGMSMKHCNIFTDLPLRECELDQIPRLAA